MLSVYSFCKNRRLKRSRIMSASTSCRKKEKSTRLSIHRSAGNLKIITSGWMNTREEMKKATLIRTEINFMKHSLNGSAFLCREIISKREIVMLKLKKQQFKRGILNG